MPRLKDFIFELFHSRLNERGLLFEYDNCVNQYW